VKGEGGKKGDVFHSGEGKKGKALRNFERKYLPENGSNKKRCRCPPGGKEGTRLRNEERREAYFADQKGD